MDFDIGDVGADDPIEWTGAAAEGSSHAEAPVTLKGRVTQRLVPTQELPPEDFVLADPQVPLPVLRFQLLQPGGVGCTQRVRCSLWGLWCDRLSEVIKVGHEVAGGHAGERVRHRRDQCGALRGHRRSPLRGHLLPRLRASGSWTLPIM